MVVDLLFSIHGRSAPLDHGYSLYAALSRVLGTALHRRNDIGIFHLPGTRTERNTIALRPLASLRVRVPDARIKDILPLAGKAIVLDGHRLTIGVPRVVTLIPAASLQARMVDIKLSRSKDGPPPRVTPEAFLAAARKKLTNPPHEDPGKAGLGLSSSIEISIPQYTAGPRKGQPRRKVLRIKNQMHVGFPLLIASLSPEESLLLQEQGIGGRRLMGCGLFVPARENA